MFKAKRIDTGKVYQVLDTWYDDKFHQTYFFLWDNNGWRWRPATKFVPPTINPNDIPEIKQYRESSVLIDDDPPFK